MAFEHAPQDMSTSYLYCEDTMICPSLSLSQKKELEAEQETLQ